MQQMPPPMHPQHPQYSPHHAPHPHYQQAPAPKKPTNKALLAVGIGCGALLLMAGIVAVVGIFWVKSKVTGAIGTVEEIAAQEERLKALDTKYPFTPPARGKPLQLDEKRLQDYLAIRQALVPVFKVYEAKAKDLDARHPKDQGIGAGLEAIGMTGELIRDIRTNFAKELDKKRMSSKEFHTITGTIYASYIGKGVAALQDGQREMLEKSIGELDKQLASKSLPAESRKLIASQREMFAKQLAELPAKATIPAADKAIYEANTALFERYKAQIEKEANPALDAFLFGDTSGIENAFQPLQGMGQ